MKKIFMYYNKLKIQIKITSETKKFIEKILLYKLESLKRLREIHSSFLENYHVSKNMKFFLNDLLSNKIIKTEKKIKFYEHMYKIFQKKYEEYTLLKDQFKTILEKQKTKKEIFLDLINLINLFNLKKTSKNLITNSIFDQSIENFVLSFFEKLIRSIKDNIIEIEKIFQNEILSKTENSISQVEKNCHNEFESYVQKIDLNKSSFSIEKIWDSESTSKINDYRKPKINVKKNISKIMNFDKIEKTSKKSISDHSKKLLFNDLLSINNYKKEFESPLNKKDDLNAFKTERNKNENMENFFDNYDNKFTLCNKMKTKILSPQNNFSEKENLLFNQNRNETPIKKNPFHRGSNIENKSCNISKKNSNCFDINLNKKDYIKLTPKFFETNYKKVKRAF